jgi:isoaspartyl peptidase/L-asparaginase-like protein (Ntn-hydrolase superfamily)
MIDRKADGDAAASLMERHWFASIAAVRTMQAECEVLREVMELTEGAWRRARSQLARLEAMRDALGEELMESERQQWPRDDPAHVAQVITAEKQLLAQRVGRLTSAASMPARGSF